MKSRFSPSRWPLLVSIGLAGWFGASSARAAGPAVDQTWPQWRGPTGTGAAPSAEPPTAWSETNNVRWKVKIPGQGTATPIVWENRVFVQTAIPTGKKVDAPAAATDDKKPGAPRLGADAKDKKDAKSAPDAKTEKKSDASKGGDDAKQGKQPPRGSGQFGGRPGGPGGPGGGFGMRTAKPTEAFQFVLLCLDRQSGKELWRKVAREEVPHEGHHPDHGFSSHSPITDGKHVYAYFGSRGLHCYDLDGNLKWSKDFGRMKTKLSFGEGSSPTLFGNTIVVNWDHEGDDFIVALNAETGKELWRTPRDEETSWATPIIVQVGTQNQVVTAATRKIRSYDLATGKLVWEGPGLTTSVIPSPVAGDGIVYATSGFRGSELFAIRLGRTGDLSKTDAIVWSHHKSTPYVPSPLLYGDRLYFFASNNGILSCFDAKTGKPTIEPQRVEGLSGVYASPVGAGGRIYLVGRNGTSVVVKHADKLEILATNRLDDRIDASPAIVGKELFLRGRQALYCIAEK